MPINQHRNPVLEPWVPYDADVDRCDETTFDDLLAQGKIDMPKPRGKVIDVPDPRKTKDQEEPEVKVNLNDTAGPEEDRTLHIYSSDEFRRK